MLLVPWLSNLPTPLPVGPTPARFCSRLQNQKLFYDIPLMQGVNGPTDTFTQRTVWSQTLRSQTRMP